MNPEHTDVVPAEPTDRYPVVDPGLDHVERYTDVNEGAATRVYRQLLLMLALVPPLAIAFIVIYFTVPREMYIDLGLLKTNALNFGLGLTAGIAVLLIGLAAIQWARELMSDHEIVQERHPIRSDPETRERNVQGFKQGVRESGIGRRKLLGSAMLGALGIVVVPPIVLLADMGPHPTRKVRAETIEKTLWAEGVKLVSDVDFKPIKAADLEIGQLVNAQPENLPDLHGAEYQIQKAKASIIVVRMDPQSIKIPESRQGWQVNGILCYSKICTHVGCPISLWEQRTHHLLCPCHQSTFDLGDSGLVVFGPAARALPQLPIKVNEAGELVAQSDFTVPVGASYWERDSRNDYKEGDR